MKEKNKAMLEVLICSVLWSIAGIFIKLIDCSPFVISGFRGLFSALTVLVFFLITKKKFVFSKKTMLIAICYAMLFFAFVLANKLTTAANTIVLQYTSPIWLMLISVTAKKSRFGAKDVIVAIVTLFGIALCFLDQMEGGYLLGNIVAIFAGLLMATMYFFMGDTTEDERFSSQLLGHALTAVIGISFVPFTTNTLDLRAFTFLAILGIVQLGIPYILLALSAKACPPFAMAIIGAAEPLLNPIWVAIFDGERPGPVALIGCIIVIIAVTVWTVLDNRKDKRNS